MKTNKEAVVYIYTNGFGAATINENYVIFRKMNTNGYYIKRSKTKKQKYVISSYLLISVYRATKNVCICGNVCIYG